MYPALPSEKAGVVSTIDPANITNTTANGDYVDMSKFHEVMFIALTGAMDATFDFLIRESQDTGGTGEQNLTGKAITQETGGDEDNLQWVINVKSAELAQGYRFVRPRVTTGTGTTNLIAVIGIALSPRFAPASDDDLASVDQIIN
jgi:hypothetical protein